jgi:hypothetical protein
MTLENYPSSRNDPMDAYNDQNGLRTKYPVYRYAFVDNAFTNEQRAWIGEGFARMSALGPTAVPFVDGTHRIVVAHWPDDNSVNPTTDTTPNAGRTTWLADGKIRIEFDPQGLHGPEAWITAAAHEMGHVFNGNRKHVPAANPAIMNATIAEVVFDGQAADDTMSGSPPPRAATKWDFELFDRSNGR